MKIKVVVGTMLMLFMASVLSLVSNIAPAIAESPAFVPFERVSSGKLFYGDFNDGVADGWTVRLGMNGKLLMENILPIVLLA